MRSPLQIEAEHDGAGRHPLRQMRNQRLAAIRPPVVITLSPRRVFLMRLACSFAFLRCGRMTKKYAMAKIITKGTNCIKMSAEVGAAAVAACAKAGVNKIPSP